MKLHLGFNCMKDQHPNPYIVQGLSRLFKDFLHLNLSEILVYSFLVI